MDDPFDLLGKKNLEGLKAVLSANPSLARMRAASGASLLAWAHYSGQPDATSIIRPHIGALDPYDAIIVGDIGAVREALDGGWDAGERAPDGFTPLALAAFFRQADIFDLLLPLTKDLNAQSSNPQQVAALHAAVAQRQPNMVQDLLRAGADPNLKQADGVTALHSAAFHGDAAIAGLLLLFGADLATTNDKGETAADLARSQGHDWLADRL